MTREDRLKFCKNCTKQEFDKLKGILCSLTNKVADFENECPDYEETEAKKAKNQLSMKFIESLKKKGELKISSNFTKFGLFIGAILILGMIPVLILTTREQDFHGGMVLAGLIYLALVGFEIYLFVYSCDARINGDKLVLKKLFRTEKTYTFDKIGEPSSFQIKRTKYITVPMQNDNKIQEKYLILNSKSILAFENKDAEQVLKTLRDLV